MTGDFDIKLLQAEHGDAMLVSYGHDTVRHLLIDGGPASSLRNLMDVLAAARTNGILTLEAIVVTHYDYDHIGGIIALLEQAPDWLIINDIWFNGNKHLVPQDMLGPQHSDTLARLIVEQQLPWNKEFHGNAVCSNWANKISLRGGVTVEILSPSRKELTALAKRGGVCILNDEKAGPRDRLGRHDSWPPPSHASLLEKRTPADQSASNASSIALLLNYGEKRILLSGDAHADVICEALEKSWPGRKLQIDLLKISHHGSQANTSTSLLSRIQCKRFAFSTNGKIHSHPDQIAIARVIASIYNPELIFNYANMWTNRWRNRPALWPVYSTVYPNTDVPYVRVIV